MGFLHLESLLESRRLIGIIVGKKYRLIRSLGEGGMGAVYEAEHVDTSERVAVKLLRDQYDQPETKARFRREALATADVHDKHIARVLDFGVDDSTQQHYLVMELLEGEDLQALITRLGPLPPALALRIASQALRGLECAHEARIVHRDVKPSNVFLAHGSEGAITVKLVDFGIAKILTDSANATALTKTGGLLGSPAYMSPEQVEDTRHVDHRTDLWSLGATLYCAIAGHPPHTIESLPKLLMAIGSRSPKPLEQVVPWVSSDIAKFVRAALTIDKDKRYASAAAMRQALAPLLPEGDSVRPDMLVPLPDEDRAVLVRTVAQSKGPLRILPQYEIPERTMPQDKVAEPFVAPVEIPQRSRTGQDPGIVTASATVTRPASEPIESQSGTKQPEGRGHLRRLTFAVGLTVTLAAAAMLVAASSRHPTIAPILDGKRGIVLTGAFLGTEEGKLFCHDLADFDTGQQVECLDGNSDTDEQLGISAKKAGALLFVRTDERGLATLVPLGKLEHDALLGQTLTLDVSRRSDWPRIGTVLGALTRIASPHIDVKPGYTCPPMPEGDMDRLGLVTLLLVPACATQPIVPERLLATCRTTPESDDCALARYLYTDRCPSCPDTHELLNDLAQKGPERFRPLAMLKLARAACTEGDVDTSTNLLLALARRSDACTHAALPEVAACITSRSTTIDMRIADIEAAPIDAEGRCPDAFRAAILARRGYYRGRAGRWSLAENDYAEAYRLAHSPLEALSLIEAQLHQGRARQAYERIVGLGAITFEGTNQFYAALLRWIAARDGGAPPGRAEANALVGIYENLAVGTNAIDPAPDPDLRAITCPTTNNAECAYDILSSPKTDGSVERLRQSLGLD